MTCSAAVEAGGGGGELLTAELELIAPALLGRAGVCSVLIGDALGHCVELIEGAHTIWEMHQARRP